MAKWYQATKATAQPQKQGKNHQGYDNQNNSKRWCIGWNLEELQLLEVLENHIMDTEIPAQLHKVEIRKAIKTFEDQRNREFWNSVVKDDKNKHSKHNIV